MGYRGTVISGGVARQKPLGSGDVGDANVWVTTSSGVSGIDDLYTAAGANLSDGDIGIIDTSGTPVAFTYSTTAKNWVRLNPFSTGNDCYFVEASKTNGFRTEDATTVGWDNASTAHSYSDPDNIMTASGASAYLQTDDGPFSMTEVGFIVLHKFMIATGATNTPIFDLRRDDGASPYPNLRLYVAAGTWQINAVSPSNTGVAYSQNTDFSFEVYYNYATSRCWVYHNYSATPTSVANSSVTLPTTTGSRSGLMLQNNSGVLSIEGAGYGHMVTER